MPALRVLSLNLPFYPTVADLQGNQSVQSLNSYFKNLTTQVAQWSNEVTNAVNGGLLPAQTVSASFAVGNNASGVIVTMSPSVPTGIHYVVLMQPTWDAGGYWVTPSNNTSFTLNWHTVTPATTTFGLVIALDMLASG